MYYKQIQRNRPISTLIKWYSDKKSGKVTDARKEIQRRFDYLDWKDQKRIMLAFLQSGKSDRDWAYAKIFRQWDKCFLEPVKVLWEKYHEYVCAWSVIQHFPIEYVKQNAALLEEVNGYYHLCMRLAEDATYQIEKSKLLGKEYLLVMLNTHREVSPEEAKDIFFNSLHHYCVTTPVSGFDVFPQDRNHVLSIYNIEVFSSLKNIIGLLGLDDVVKYIDCWNGNVMFAIYQSEELKELDKEAISDYEYHKKLIAIELKYMYLALDDKYKEPADELPFMKLNEPAEQIEKHALLQESAQKADNYVNGTDAPKVLEEMIAKRPAIGNLVNSFTLTFQEDETRENIPF